MGSVVSTLNYFTQANKQLQEDNGILRAENENLVGHQNPNQKIQYHLKMKEENNRLREENMQLQDDLARKVEVV